jgi:hypothetical protein
MVPVHLALAVGRGTLSPSTPILDPYSQVPIDDLNVPDRDAGRLGLTHVGGTLATLDPSPNPELETRESSMWAANPFNPAYDP